jgi:hypothetical protein
MLTLPTDSAERKEYPLYSGAVAYFPAALAGVAKHSKLGNDKHNPGEPMHHARGKSGDHADCIIRHTVDIGDIKRYIDSLQIPHIALCDEDRATLVEMILTEANALAWRALALSQELHEVYGGAPLAPGARLPAPPAPPSEPSALPHGGSSRGMDTPADEYRKDLAARTVIR